MKYILAIFLMATTITAYAQDAPQDNGASDFRTFKLALTKTRWDNLTVQGKVMSALAKYQFSTDTPTDSEKASVLAQMNFTGFVATVNTNLPVYVYDYSLPKARPNEPGSMSWGDLVILKAKVDDDPQIAMDIIRRSQSEAWYKDNGISHKVTSVQP